MHETFQEIPFDPNTADDDLWRKFHVYRRARWEERGDPNWPFSPDDNYADSLRALHRDEDDAHYHFVVAQGDQVIASFGGWACRPGSANHGANGHILRSSGTVLKAWRRRGIGRSWLERTLEWMPLTGATTLTVWVDDPDGHPFMRAICGEPRQIDRLSRTDLHALDWAMVDRWVAAARETAPGYVVELYEDRLPEALWPEYCAAVEELQRHAPRDGLDMGDWRFTPKDLATHYEEVAIQKADHHVVLVRDPQGEIVAVTDAGWYPYVPDQLQQFFTGVHPRTRSLGLGKLIKARMLQFARLRYAPHQLRWVYTSNATSNAAMLSINERLGFEEHLVTGTYQAGKTQIEAYLGR